MPTRLEPDVQEISLVKRGANGKKHFMFKGLSEEELDSAIDSDFENNPELLEILSNNLTKESKDMADKKTKSEAVKLPDDVQKQLDELEAIKKERDELQAEKDKELKKAEKEKGKIEKALDKMQKAFEEEKNAREEFQKSYVKEREARIMKEYEGRAAGYKNIPNKDNALAKLMKDVDDNCSDESKAFMKEMLDATNSRVESGSLFKSVGVSKEGDEKSAMDIINKAAGELTKANPSLSHAQAFEKAINMDEYRHLKKEIFNK